MLVVAPTVRASGVLAGEKLHASIPALPAETAKVTPAAFTACRSQGARNQGLDGSRWSCALLARIGARSSRRSPAVRASATGSSAFSRSVTVGAARLMSNTPSSRSATTLGPGTAPGTHARPTSVPAVPSAGNAPAGVR